MLIGSRSKEEYVELWNGSNVQTIIAVSLGLINYLR
jgi:hypothetical protein